MVENNKDWGLCKFIVIGFVSIGILFGIIIVWVVNVCIFGVVIVSGVIYLENN